MDPIIKEKWVKALRDGEIKQGRGKLLSPDGAMCCLGVLALVQGKDDEWLTYNADKVYNFNTRPKVWPEDHVARKLADFNDDGQSFAEIADYIEGHL